MKKIPKILLIGAGRFGLNYVRILNNLEKNGDIEIKGVLVRYPENYQNISKKYRISFFNKVPKNILAEIDAVIIVTPPESHFKLAKKYLKYCDVFIEKPLTTNHKESEELQNIATKYKRTLIVGQIFRFNEISKKLKALIQNSLPQKIDGYFINPKKTDQGREPSLELLHLFDVIDYLWPIIPQSIFATKTFRLSTVDIRYTPNCDAKFYLGWNGSEKIRNLIFTYDKKIIKADFVKNKIEIINKSSVLLKKYEFNNMKEPLNLEIKNFIKKIKTNKKSTNIETASRVLSTAIRSIPAKPKLPRVAIIGGGIFGLSVALELGSFCKVTVFERNNKLMQEGTLVNQFRHHYGYHYPRSNETVLDVQRSRADFEKIFKDALFTNSPTYYALAKKGSRINVKNFIKFCHRHKLPYKKEYPSDKFLSKKEINLSIRVPEPSYHHKTLKKIIESKIDFLPNINICTGTLVDSCVLSDNGNKKIIYTKNNKTKGQNFDYVINATYANINRFTGWLNFAQCQIRVDLAEVLIVKIPIKPVSVTVIDGLFATLMPTGNPNEFTLYHVKESIIDRYVPIDGLVKTVKKYKSNRDAIMRESLKFFPILKDAKIIESRIIHRGVQAHHEHDDSRVVDLINHGFGCWSILSGKILSSITTAKRLSKEIKKTME